MQAWESRYKSQALKTDHALLACMAYADLNPIRANLANTPENSDYTSIQERIKPKWDLKKAIQRQVKQKSMLPLTDSNINNIKPSQLMTFAYPDTSNKQTSLPFNLIDYLELVDWTGRIIREDKRGHIKQTTPPILERLEVNNKDWLLASNQFENIFNKRFNQRRIKANSS